MTAPPAPLRYQFYVVGGIFLFTGAFGASVYGVRAGLGSLYAVPACEEACGASGAHASDVDYRVGKTDHQSFCVCTNGQRLPSAEANIVAQTSVIVPMAGSVLVTIGLLLWLAARGRSKARNIS